jgi:FdhE protein
MPPIDGDEISRDPEVHETVRRFFAEAADIGMPPAASEALQHAASRPEAEQTVALRQLFAAEEDHVGLAEQAFVAAGLQIHLGTLAAGLDARGLVEIGPGICPACGGRPVASVVAGWQGAENARYCACSLCGTLWNFVRVKCTRCGSTEGIGYRHVEESGEAIKAECCDKCHGYSKVLYTVTDPSLEPFADDVASLALDLLMQDEPYRRTAFNPFLIR